MTQIVNINKVQTITSLEIAELTGKKHKHVMEAIRRMEPAWVNMAGSNFRLGSYKDANGQLRPCYTLTKTECLYIATKFEDEARASGSKWIHVSYVSKTKNRHRALRCEDGKHYKYTP